MTQIETIIAEVERRIVQFKEERSKISPTTPKSVDRLSLGEKIAALEEILVFIKSLPIEQPSEQLCWNDMIEEEKSDFFFELSHQEQPSNEFEDLEESIIEFLGHVPENEPDHSETLYTYEQMQEIARHFADWQKEKDINIACKWLNQNVVEYHPRTRKLRPIVNINAFREAMEKEDEK